MKKNNYRKLKIFFFCRIYYHGLGETIVSLLLQNHEERYLDLLSGNKNKIIERNPQHYVANYLGITPVSMIRIRNRLMKKK